MALGNRRRKCEGNCEGVDRISELPDALLSHILSFVSTKTALETSILSKRWLLVWTLVPVLDFTEVRSEYDKERLTPDEILLYKSFVDKVLFHNNVSHLQHLCFKHFKGCDNSYFESWITALVRRQISVINLQSFAGWLLLPDKLFVSERLRVMRLRNFSIDLPISLHLPLLETLQLEGVKFEGDDFIQKLSSGCPALKKLIVHCCVGMPRLSILSSTLEKLTVLHSVDMNTSYTQRYLLIDAPQLKYLHLENFMLQCDIVNSTSLAKANIKISTDDDYIYDMSWVVKLLKGLCSVQVLRFHVCGTRHIDASQLSEFSNLTHLKSLADKCVFPILERAPQLESLTLQLSEGLRVGLIYSKCFARIIHIEVLAFTGNAYNTTLVGCILNLAPVLKKMKVHAHASRKQLETNTSDFLLMLPRASKDCQVELCTSRRTECSTFAPLE